MTENARLRGGIVDLAKDVQLVVDKVGNPDRRADVDGYEMVSRLLAILVPDTMERLKIAGSETPLIDTLESLRRPSIRPGQEN